jgi:hypothetical protein
MKNDFEEIWERIRKETDLKTLADLGQVIEKKQQTISYSKTKNEFSPAWAYLVGKKYGILTEWIMTGEGPKRLGEEGKARKFDILNQAEEWLTDEVIKNPKREFWFEVEFEKAFEEFKKWKEEKEESAAEEAYSSSRKVA